MKILVVDDQKFARITITRFLEVEQMEVLSAENGLSAKRILENEIVSAVITDLSMPGMDGLELLKWIQEEGPAIPVIMISAFGDIADAVEAIKLGAQDYIVKPFDPEELVIRVKRIIENQQLKEQVELGKWQHPEFKNWIGESSKMLEIKELVERVAPTPSTILITGESGTGKEVVARAIHKHSLQADEPFIAINIAGVPENLLEGELFGYEKGAFTGATSRKIGMFELASTGALFLDEIGDMPTHLQVKLLRVIQERKIQRLGGTQSIPINARILSATNKNLEERVQKGLFREDLYYRLNVIQIKLPPLRERREDIPLLAGYFIRKFNKTIGKSIQGIESEAIKALQGYEFPGNVRELENIIERAVILANTKTITLRDLGLISSVPKVTVKSGTLEEVQKQAILEALRRWDGNRTRAAEELGINRRTIQKKIKEYGLENV
jgi:two-component system response regulator AtoC